MGKDKKDEQDDKVEDKATPEPPKAEKPKAEKPAFNEKKVLSSLKKQAKAEGVDFNSEDTDELEIISSRVDGDVTHIVTSAGQEATIDADGNVELERGPGFVDEDEREARRAAARKAAVEEALADIE